MGVVKIIFGVLCFGVGVAFAIGAAELLEEPELGAPVAAMFLLASFLLLRIGPNLAVSFSQRRPEARCCLLAADIANVRLQPSRPAYPRCQLSSSGSLATLTAMRAPCLVAGE